MLGWAESPLGRGHIWLKPEGRERASHQVGKVFWAEGAVERPALGTGFVLLSGQRASSVAWGNEQWEEAWGQRPAGARACQAPRTLFIWDGSHWRVCAERRQLAGWGLESGTLIKQLLRGPGEVQQGLGSGC